MTRTFTRTDQLVERRIRDEHILVPVGDNLYALDSLFTLNPVASFIWEGTAEPRSEQELVERVVDAYDVPASEAAEDTRGILDELVEIGALTCREAAV